MSGSSTIPTLTAFTAGDIVISVVGDANGGGTTYTDNQAAPITLEEIDPTTGDIVGEMVLPQNSVTSGTTTENAISGEYGSSSEGALSLAGNGQSLVIAGYGVNAATYNSGGAAVYGNAALAQSTSIQGGEYTAVARVIADIGYNGTVDTSTALYNVFNTNNPRSVATVNGKTFYISGQGVKGDTTQGVFVAQDGASSATVIDDANDTRTLEIYDGRLYVSEDSTQPSGTGTSNIASFGLSLPTSATAPTILSGISQSITLTAAETNSLNASAVGTKVDLSPEAFFFANATTLYVADGGQPKEGTIGDGGLQKWILNTTTGVWQLAYTLSAGLNLIENGSVSSDTSGTTGLIGLSGVLNADGTVTFYATNSTIGDLDQTYLYTITDTVSATTAASGESFKVVETAAPDSNIRGIAQAPSAPTSVTISAGQTTSAGQVVTNGSTLTVLTSGTASAVVVSSGGAAYISGSDTASLIVAGGAEAVYSGATATADQVYGTQTVSGGAVTGESVFDGGNIDLSTNGSTANGTTVNYGGMLGIDANATATNTVIDGGVVALNSSEAVLAGSVTFSGAGEIIETTVISAGYGDLATISGFAAGDFIDMTEIGSGATLSTSVVSGNTIETVTSGGVSESFVFAGQYNSGTFDLISDGNGGVELTVSPSTVTGTLTISSGVTSEDTTVSGGGSVTVLSGGALVSATILSGGSVMISGSDAYTAISAGGSETLLGSATAVGDQIYGAQTLTGTQSSTAVVVTSETVFSGGALDLFLKGAVANATTINSGGSLVISGNATAINTVIDGGTLELESAKAVLSGTITFSGSGGLLEDTTVASSGYGDFAIISGFGAGDVIDLTSIDSGATLSSSIVSGNTIETITSGSKSANFIFSGTNYSAGYFVLSQTTSGAEITVSTTVVSSAANTTTVTSGQTISAGVISGGYVLDVQAGGTASGVTVASGGSASFAGTDSGTVISAEGNVTLTGVETNATLLTSGNELVLGSATGDQIYGTQLVSAANALVTDETVFNGGNLNLFLKGASAVGTTISSGGTLNISGNATAFNTIIDGGTLDMQSSKSVVSGGVTFTGGGTLIEDTLFSASYGNLATISGFGVGDTIDLTAIGAGATMITGTSNGETVVLISGGSLAGSNTESFTFANSGNNGDDFVFSTTASGGEITVVSTTSTISSGQSTPTSAVVSGGYVLDVASGGSATSVTVLSGGSASFAGTDSGTVISSGGSVLLTGVETSATILAGGSETIQGSATGDQIYGTQLASSGTPVVTSETVFGGGAVELFANGGVASAVTINSGGSLNISGSATASNAVINGGSLVLDSSDASLTGSLDFSGASGSLIENALISTGSADLATISGFAAGDSIDLRAIGTGATMTSVTSGGDTIVTISGGSTASGNTETFIFAGTSYQFSLVPDGGVVAEGANTDRFSAVPDSATGEELVTNDSTACYCTGTKILTLHGEIAVEDIRIGDELVTVREGGPASRKVIWTGQRPINLMRHPAPENLRPICILAGAIAPEMPARNLRVSPHHAIYLDGKLFEAQSLINGITIFQEQTTRSVTYHHIELEAHDILLAEGLPAESYLDTGNRDMFENEGATVLHPNFKSAADANFCVPLVLEGEALNAIREKLQARAAKLTRAA